MADSQNLTMSQHYINKYGEPKDNYDATYLLVSVYEELLEETATQEVRDGIAQYYKMLSNRELPAYEWILECLAITSKKEKSKRNFAYCVGMLRSWMTYGFGHIPNQEEDELVDYFQEVTGFAVNYKSRRILQSLMGKYGVIKITKMIGALKDDEEKSLVMMLHLQALMEKKFDTPQVEEMSSIK